MPEHLRIVSYNIHKSVGRDGVRNPARIVQVLGKLNPDIALLQEVDRRIGKREATLGAAALRQAKLEIAQLAIRPDSAGWHGNGVLINAEAGIKILGTQRIKLPVFEPRGAVQIDLQLASGQEISLIGVHLSLSERFRRKQITFLSDHIMKLPKERPVIVGGDFNHWRQKNLSFTGIDPTLRVITPGRTYPSDKPFLPLDRFMLCGPIKTVKFEVVQTQLTRIASDHLPVYLDIEV